MKLFFVSHGSCSGQTWVSMKTAHTHTKCSLTIISIDNDDVRLLRTVHLWCLGGARGRRHQHGDPEKQHHKERRGGGATPSPSLGGHGLSLLSTLGNTQRINCLLSVCFSQFVSNNNYGRMRRKLKTPEQHVPWLQMKIMNSYNGMEHVEVSTCANWSKQRPESERITLSLWDSFSFCTILVVFTVCAPWIFLVL